MADAIMSRSTRRGYLIAAAIVAALATVKPAHATPTTYYDVQILGVTTGDGLTQTGSAQLTDSGSGATADGTYSFSVLAGPGVLGDENSLTLASAGSALGDVRSTTSFVLDNITLTGPAGATYVNYDVNFTVTGSFALTASGNAVAKALVGVADVLGPLGGMDVSTNPNDLNDAAGVFSGATPGPNTSVDITGTTHQQTGVNGSTVSVNLTMYTDIDAGLNDGSASGTVDFLDPLSLSEDGPVFNFFNPATGEPVTGWTANSSDGCIVNNAYVCGPTNAAPVDEPPTWSIFAAAAVAWTLWRGRRRRRPVRLATA